LLCIDECVEESKGHFYEFLQETNAIFLMKQQFMKLRDKGKYHLIVINDSCLRLTSESFESIEVDKQVDVFEIFLVYHES
jgi:hypothetical protein